LKEISASKFKEQWLSLLDHLDPEGIVVTKRGKAVARVIPADSGCAALIGSMKGR
jgi:antitoxin (DNA-binding transcriptional repressor) of toxin-antitoxin stability system